MATIIPRLPHPTPFAYNPGSEMTSSQTSNDSPEVLSDADPIVSLWQRFASMDRQSSHFLPLLLSLTTGTNRSSTTALRGDDAKITLGVLDEVGRPFFAARKWPAGNIYHTIHQLFRDGKIPDECERVTLGVMRLLAHDSSQVPPRYQVKPHTLSIEGGVIADGASSNIRKGRLGGKTVAVRTLKVDQGIDPRDVQKVCYIHLSLRGILTKGTFNPALLQGVYHLDEGFSSPPLTAHRRRH